MRSKGILVGSIWQDLLLASLLAVVTVELWAIFSLYFGRPGSVNTEMMTFLGGVISVAGLLFKQYMLKEVLDYLRVWKRMNTLLTDIIRIMDANGHREDKHFGEFLEQKREADRYSRYVQHELFVVPYVPLLLILLYGCTLFAQDSLTIRVFCMYGMIVCVTYLSITAVTSCRIISDHPELEALVRQLEDIYCKMKNPE